AAARSLLLPSHRCLPPRQPSGGAGGDRAGSHRGGAAPQPPRAAGRSRLQRRPVAPCGCRGACCAAGLTSRLTGAGGSAAATAATSGPDNERMSDSDALVRMEIKGLMLDPTSNIPIVVLREQGGQVFLPIWIGVFEANAIALRIEGIEPPRPLTHDLLRSVFTHFAVEVRRVVISDLRENTFFARIEVSRAGEDSAIDARPSDAVALAVRTDAATFVRRDVLERAKAVDLATHAADDEKLKEWLEELNPE